MKFYFLVSFIIVCRYGLSKNRAELNKSFCPCILSQVYRVDTRNPKIAHAILHSAHVGHWENLLNDKKKKKDSTTSLRILLLLRNELLS